MNLVGHVGVVRGDVGARADVEPFDDHGAVEIGRLLRPSNDHPGVELALPGLGQLEGAVGGKVPVGLVRGRGARHGDIRSRCSRPRPGRAPRPPTAARCRCRRSVPRRRWRRGRPGRSADPVVPVSSPGLVVVADVSPPESSPPQAPPSSATVSSPITMPVRFISSPSPSGVAGDDLARSRSAFGYRRVVARGHRPITVVRYRSVWPHRSNRIGWARTCRRSRPSR
jgi:hypothetical protein